MSYTGNFSVNSQAAESQTVNISSLRSSANVTNSRSYVDGSGAGQINLGTTNEETLAPAGSTDYDLDAGTMLTLMKENATYTKVKHITVVNTGDNAMELSGNFFGISTEKLPIPAGGHVDYDYGDDGRDVTAATQDTITVESTAGTDYKIMIAGVGTIS